MRSVTKLLLGAATGAGVLAFSALGASAEIVCSEDACWHTHTRYDYPPSAGVIVHPDTWRWGPSDRYRWREHEGRGYWHGDRWVEW